MGEERQGDVVFRRVAGAADRSYGHQVAQLAGLPAPVIERAKLVLAQLEAEDRLSPARRLIDDLPLFAAVGRKVARDELRAALEALQPDDLSPREALEALYALKATAADRRPYGAASGSLPFQKR